jgi:hypothetical protein
VPKIRKNIFWPEEEEEEEQEEQELSGITIVKPGKIQEDKKYAGPNLNMHFCQYHEQYEKLCEIIIIIGGNKVFSLPFNILCFFPLMLFLDRV